jgi:isoleucyl-tRNA synthetase
MNTKKSSDKLKHRPYFDKVDTKIDFSKMESEILTNWYKRGVVKKYLRKNADSKKYFSFLDGPITANNPMGVHHAWGRTYKDLWQRYKNMQGYKQRFQNGFDSQGLWIEVEVEKELGFKSKKDIEKYGIAKFVKKCKRRVKRYSKVQTDQSKRLGYFMDWDNSYFTMSDYNNYMIWHFLKVCDNNGWLYKGNDSVPWCPRCETAISQHEILTEDYKELVHESIVLKYPIVGRSQEFLLVWTTTPWTIPANIAIALDEDLDYALVGGDEKGKYWLAKDTIERVFGKGKKTLKVVRGKKLVGLKYAGAFDGLPKVKKMANKYPDKFHTVVATDQRIMPVTTEEGTGLVHTAVSAGAEDFKLGQKLGLPMVLVINDDATYMSDLGVLSGKNAKDNPNLIFDFLKGREKKFDEEWVFDIFNYKHRYPVCWRCKTELVWKVTDEWYVAMDKPSKKSSSGKSDTLRERMKKVTKKIKWIPGFGLKRELDWLSNMHDWLISKKNRYWGLALPIWECNKCSWFYVVGSKEELKKKAVDGWKEFEGKSPHKPQIDKVKIKCEKCGNLASRIEPVGNPWLDAGIVSYSTISQNNKASTLESRDKPLYLKDKKSWMKWFPADFITESFPGQFKNWFYSLIAMSTVLENRHPFKTVLGFATLLGDDGRPMHKSWGNAIDFDEGAERIGVDVMRWMYIRQNPTDNLLFGYRTADEVRRKFHLKIWNIYNFFVTYANLDGWPRTELTSSRGLRPRSRRALIRGKKPTNSSNVLDKWILARLKQTVNSVTVNLDNYDAYNASVVIEEFIEDLSNWYIRRSRERVGLIADSNGDKEEFYETAYFVLLTICKLLAPLTPYLSEVIYKNLTKEESVHLSNWPSSKKISTTDKKLVEKMQIIREVVERGHAERKLANIPVRQPLQSIKVSSPDKKPTKEFFNLTKDELNVRDVVWTKSKELSIKLDKTITAELLEEAKARELIRKIQSERRKLGFSLKEPAVVTNEWLPKQSNLIDKIKRVTLARKLESGKFGVKRYTKG